MFVLISLLAVPFAAAAYDPDSNKTEFTSYETTWHDADRNRDLPVKIYYPKESDAAKGKLPIIIFSHGLGGSREGYKYLGESWASHGYVAVHLTHLGSDTSAVMEAGLDKVKQQAVLIANNPTNAVNRCHDVSFAIDELTIANVDDKSPLKGRLDLDKIGMAGHSFGANTTTLIAGEMTVSGKTALADKRVKCAIAMSPPVPAPQAMWDKVYSTIKVPLFVMTGTKDDSPIGDTTAAVRRVPFDHVKDIAAYLITFDGGDHMLFSGRRTLNKLATDDQYHELILQGSLAFWDAWLRRNTDAANWLSAGGYEKAVGAAGKFEVHKIEHPR